MDFHPKIQKHCSGNLLVTKSKKKNEYYLLVSKVCVTYVPSLVGFVILFFLNPASGSMSQIQGKE